MRGNQFPILDLVLQAANAIASIDVQCKNLAREGPHNKWNGPSLRHPGTIRPCGACAGGVAAVVSVSVGMVDGAGRCRCPPSTAQALVAIAGFFWRTSRLEAVGPLLVWLDSLDL